MLSFVGSGKDETEEDEGISATDSAEVTSDRVGPTSEAKEEGEDWLDDAFVDPHEVMQSVSRRKRNACCFIISPN